MTTDNKTYKVRSSPYFTLIESLYVHKQSAIAYTNQDFTEIQSI